MTSESGLDDLAHGYWEPGVDGAFLREVPDAEGREGAIVGGKVLYCSGGRSDELEEYAEECCLAAAVRPGYGEKVAGADLQINSVENEAVGVPHVDL